MLTILSPLRRWLTGFLLLNLIAVNAAHAAPASKESLTKYFEVNNVPTLVDRAVESIGAAKAKAWQDETDPAAKAEKKAEFDMLEAMVRRYISWQKLEPIAVASYQRRLDESDVRELIAYAQSPGGQLRIKRLSPAVIEVLPAVFAHMDKRIDEISERKDDAPVPAAPVFAPPAAGSKEALALTLISDMPGAREEFKLRMASMETAMLSAVEAFEVKDKSGMVDGIKRMAAKIQREITFEEIASLQAKLLANKLTEAEFIALINEHRQPALQKLLAKQQLADREFSTDMNKHLTSEIMPALMGELMSKPAAKKQPAKKAVRKDAKK